MAHEELGEKNFLGGRDRFNQFRHIRQTCSDVGGSSVETRLVEDVISDATGILRIFLRGEKNIFPRHLSGRYATISREFPDEKCAR